MAGGFVLTFDMPYGLRPVRRELRRWQQGAADFRPVWRRIIDDIVSITRVRFDAEGPGWAPLSEDYGRWKARVYPGMPILQATRRLISSFTDVSHPEHVEIVTPSQMVWGSTNPYGVHHQKGTRQMPARPPFDAVPEVQKREWVKVAQRHIMAGGGEITRLPSHA